jgi:hypothetical protein
MIKTGLFISGFLDGEGSFTVGLLQEASSKWGVRVRPVFQLTQSRKDKFLLAQIQALLGVGRLHEGAAELFELVVDSKETIFNTIVPFLDVRPES